MSAIARFRDPAAAAHRDGAQCFTATPARPTCLQRLALRRLFDAFAGAEIRFAAPSVMVQLASAAVG